MNDVEVRIPCGCYCGDLTEGHYLSGETLEYLREEGYLCDCPYHGPLFDFVTYYVHPDYVNCDEEELLREPDEFGKFGGIFKEVADSEKEFYNSYREFIDSFNDENSHRTFVFCYDGEKEYVTENNRGIIQKYVCDQSEGIKPLDTKYREIRRGRG